MTTPATAVRIDKWLWAARLYKTRTLAAAACTQGRVVIEGVAVKPARGVRPGEVISAVTGDVHRTVRVLRLVERRISASQVPDHLEDLTPQAEYDRAREQRRQFGFIPRPQGTGRPTKKDRRSLDRFQSPE